MMARRNGRLADLIGDPSEIVESLRRFEKSTMYVESNYKRLLRRYPDTWIAVLDGEVRATARSVPALLRTIDAQGIPRAETYIDYLDTNPPILIV
jgi:hypothetical protein